MTSPHRSRRRCSPGLRSGPAAPRRPARPTPQRAPRSRQGAHLLHQGGPLPPDGRGQLLGRPRRANHPTMITKVPLEHSSDGRHREADERALMRIEPRQASTSPVHATCSRSSSSSPRCMNRRASVSASHRCEVTTSSRISCRLAGPAVSASTRRSWVRSASSSREVWGRRNQ